MAIELGNQDAQPSRVPAIVIAAPCEIGGVRKKLLSKLECAAPVSRQAQPARITRKMDPVVPGGDGGDHVIRVVARPIVHENEGDVRIGLRKQRIERLTKMSALYCVIERDSDHGPHLARRTFLRFAARPLSARRRGAGAVPLGHKRSMVDGSLTVKNQMPAAIAAIATTMEVANGTSGTSPTPITPHRNVATTEAIGLI